ncbi:MAG: aminotransferase class I/II-fold pyridoxal phosphate-dependent enzyme [Steroidobacteraceae bacterium]|nr:aminotransferase class I/II-fold pyridoxal phosphate-dependent enzyme [Steroidobacteraceae bacterium]
MTDDPKSDLPALSFNSNIAALPKYNAGLTLAAARAVSRRHDIARLASNENPYGCSPEVARVLASGALEIGRYSDPGCEVLRAELAMRLDVSAAEIVIGNGSEEMIAAAARSFLTSGAVALTVAPCFGLHEIEALAVGARVVKVPMTDALGFDVTALAAALATKPSLVFLPSPWNPVGAALDALQLGELVRALSPATMFVLDEAYREFVPPEIPDGIRFLRAARVPHIVLRTFSKAYGLAGLRVGYAVCSDSRIARMLFAAKTPFNVNAAAQLAAVAALQDEAWMRAAVRRITAERDRVRNELVARGVTVAPSAANFVFFDAGLNGSVLARALLKDGIVVKPWLEAGYTQFVRASIGTPEENDRLIESVERLVGAPALVEAALVDGP